MKTQTTHNTIQVLKRISVALILVLFYTQCTDPTNGNGDENNFSPTRYVDSYFEISLTSNVQYGNQSAHLIDLYEPAGDIEESRPIVILALGGSFNQLSQRVRMTALARNLASKGFVAGVMDYTVGKNTSTMESATNAYLTASAEQRAAIRYFRKNASQYRLNPDQIFIGGWSTGSQISFLTSFLNNEEDINSIENAFVKDYVTTWYESNGNSFEGNFGNEGVSSAPNGTLFMFTYLYEIGFLNSNDKVPFMMIDHEKSKLVQVQGVYTIGSFTLPSEHGDVQMSGSDIIHNKAINLGYQDGIDHDYIRMNDPIESIDWPQYWPLDKKNYQSISEFFRGLI